MTLTMTLTHLVGVCLLIACSAAQHNFADYDYQDTLSPQNPPQQARPSRPQQAPTRPFNSITTPRTPPVAILKQINRHNDDGSYTYGYEAADGSFKIETKLPTGEVMGKYGYVDDGGKLRTVEYGANRYGFQPAGDGITVPPPTLVDETICKTPNGEVVECEEENYFEPAAARPAPRPKAASRPRPRPQPQPQPQYQDVYEAPAPRPQQSFGPAPPRATISGAAPVPQRSVISGSAPTPPRASVAGAIPSGPIFRQPPPPAQYRPSPPPAQYRPSPPPASFPPAPRPAPVHEARRPAAPSSPLLDDLAQQYALPQGRSNPLHDISFGSYSSQTSF